MIVVQVLCGASTEKNIAEKSSKSKNPTTDPKSLPVQGMPRKILPNPVSDTGLTLLGPQSRFGDKLFENSVLCPLNGTAVLTGLRNPVSPITGNHSK